MKETDNDSIRLQSDLLYSERFDDFYSSREAPEREKHFVFCEGNDLPRRFTESRRFTIGELGFGAGTAFLATLALWQRTAPPGARLDYISVEKYPLDRELLARYLQRFPEWRENSKILLQRWPLPTPGFHHLALGDSGVCLTLIFDDVGPALRQLEASVDAWYLDGFSPAKNPEMWQPQVIREVARLSHGGTTVATYTAAGKVRRALTQAGFIVEKAPGYGRKRERSIGRFRVARKEALSRLPAWFRPPRRQGGERHVTIIGAGLAGCAAANRLAARGWRVTLLERGSEIASGTSSNPAAIMQPLLTRDDATTGRFFRQGYFHTLQRIAEMTRRGIDTGFHGGGLLSLAKSADDRARKAAAAANPAYPAAYLRWTAAQAIAGMPDDIDTEGLLYPQGGWLDVKQLCKAMIEEQTAGIELRTGAAVESIEKTDDGWKLETSAGALTTERLVLATGHWLRDLLDDDTLPLIVNHGQLDRAPARRLPPLPIAHKGYLISDGDSLHFGSTYQNVDEALRSTAENSPLNLAALKALSPSLAAGIDNSRIESWSGFRATTPDHMPIVGPLPDGSAWQAIYGPAMRGRAVGRSDASPWRDGLYCIGALGSRALASAPLAAELLAAMIDGGPLPTSRTVAEALQPVRFLVRAQKRGNGDGTRNGKE